ncbi:hypothetical protein HMPREF1204_03077 [Bacteroides fragilis HMW 615]|nr:hypothetical protein HMPREF1204_03077 [Bacteroides fragilis HMW 615]
MSVLHRSIELLEPYDGKLSCTVLRGESARKGADLPDLFLCKEAVLQERKEQKGQYSILMLPFYLFQHVHFRRATRKKSFFFPLRNNYNICNEGKHIEIFQKEVSIFSTCLRLSEQMLTSFPENTGTSRPKHRLSDIKSLLSEEKTPCFGTSAPPV